MSSCISFRPVDFKDIPQITYWFNLSHVQQFYSLRSWTEQEVREKLEPYINHEKPVSAFIILLESKSIGYIQSYAVKNYPWPNQNLSKSIQEQAFGMDLFIGSEDRIGKGLGGSILRAFIEQQIGSYRYCMVDPHINNRSAIRCYEKMGFKEHAIIESQDALHRPVKFNLMILDFFQNHIKISDEK